MKIGALELVVIFIVILLVIGPDKLPEYARKFGSAMREFRKASADVTQEIRESVIDPLEEAQAPLREAMEPIEDLESKVKSDIKDVKSDIENIGKPKSQKSAEATEDSRSDTVEAAAAPESGPTEENGGNAP